jgi:predicted aspartyl protease
VIIEQSLPPLPTPTPEDWTMIDLPFRLASSEIPLILVPARVNGAEAADFVLDTGNGAPVPLVVNPSLVHRLGLSPEGEGGPFPRVRLSRFELGAYALHDVEAGVLGAMDDIADRAGVRVAGNLGFAFLNRWRVRIDYAHCRLGLAPGGGAGMPFETGPGGAFILLPAEIDGRGPYRFLLDTGASASVISPRLAAELGLRGSPAEAVGVMGDLPAQVVTLPTLRAAGHTRRDAPAAVIDIFDFTSQAAGAAVDGILGYSFLKEFLVEIDYPARRLLLTRTPA